MHWNKSPLYLVLQVSDRPHLYNHSLVDPPVTPNAACSNGQILLLQIIWTAGACANQRHLHGPLQVQYRRPPHHLIHQPVSYLLKSSTCFLQTVVCESNNSVICRIVLVESIPEGVVFNSSTAHQSIYDAWLNLISATQSSLDIASFYWTLTNTDTHTQEPTANQVWWEVLWIISE